MRRLILFLIRCKLGVKRGEWFKFTNQKSDATYCITNEYILKRLYGHTALSNVSVNWILGDECEIEFLEEV